MGETTTTFNIDELITSYIDDQISDPELRSQIEQKLNSDVKLNAKYKSELLTKNMLRARLPEVEIPQKTSDRVLRSIDFLVSDAKNTVSSVKTGIAETEYPSFLHSLKESVTRRFIGIPTYAFAIAAIFITGGVLLFGSSGKTTNPYIISGTEKSVMVQALNSFHKILDGDVKPQLTSSNAAEIEKYVNDNSDFHAYIPEIAGYRLKGVVCNDYNGQKLAHLVYVNNENDVIYIYETPVSCFQKKSLDLPEQVHNEIMKAKYYMCDGVDETDCTMTLWYKDNVICVSMTTMPKQKMYSAFTGFYK
jgi:hypothetical protein